MTSDIAYWPTGTVRIEWHDTEAPDMPVTGAHGFCFHKDQVLVCEVTNRGSAIPGGHLEEDESTADCLIREASEEAGVELANLILLGFIEADHRENRHFTGQYPLRSVQAIYRADVAVIHEFIPRHETTYRQFVSVDDLPDIHHEWNAVLQAALEEALKHHDP